MRIYSTQLDALDARPSSSDFYFAGYRVSGDLNNRKIDLPPLRDTRLRTGEVIEVPLCDGVEEVKALCGACYQLRALHRAK